MKHVIDWWVGNPAPSRLPRMPAWAWRLRARFGCSYRQRKLWEGCL